MPDAHGRFHRKLGNPLHRILAELRHVRKSPVAEGRMLLDHSFDELTEALLDRAARAWTGS